MRFRDTIFPFFSILLLLSVGGCSKTQILGEYYLGELYSQNPYNGFETLVYKSSEGTLITFTGTGRKTTVYENKVSVNSNDYYIIEKDYMNLEESDGNYSMGIVLEPYNGEYNDPASIGIGWRDYVSDSSGSLTANSHFRIPLSEQNLEPEQLFFDSLLVLNKIYYNVYSDQATTYQAYEGQSLWAFVLPTVFYYNTTEGILKIDFNDGSTWELSHIENP